MTAGAAAPSGAAGSLAPAAPVAGSAPNVPVGAAGTGASMMKPPVTTPPPAGNCEVANILQQKCQSCHAASPIAGAPMSLVTYADLMAPTKTVPTKNVAKAVQERVKMTGAGMMPPSGRLADAELAAIDAWVTAGTPDCGGFSTAVMNPKPMTGPDVTGMDPPGQAVEPELCWEMLAHGGNSPTDTTPFMVKTGEFYHNFYFKAPYTKEMKGISVKALIDNSKVLHHWLLFDEPGNPDGGHADGVGIHPGATLLSGWAPGGDPPSTPPGVGQELPAVGGSYTLEIHYYNTTGSAQPDRSGAKLCATSQPLQYTASLAWLGTEAIVVPAGSRGSAEGTCTPGYGNGKMEDIHLLFSSPHMHKAGAHMKTVINRANGMTETLIDKPFAFLDQRAYETPAIVKPGDTLTTTCTWQNDTAGTILFGPSSDAEMCYNFVLSYPANALANPGNSIEGSINTCLW